MEKKATGFKELSRKEIDGETIQIIGILASNKGSDIIGSTHINGKLALMLSVINTEKK